MFIRWNKKSQVEILEKILKNVYLKSNSIKNRIINTLLQKFLKGFC